MCFEVSKNSCRFYQKILKTICYVTTCDILNNNDLVQKCPLYKFDGYNSIRGAGILNSKNHK